MDWGSTWNTVSGRCRRRNWPPRSCVPRLYKCLNPLFGKEFGFHDLVAETLETAAGTLGLRLEAPLAPRVEAGRHFEVEYRIERGAVWTAVGLRNG